MARLSELVRRRLAKLPGIGTFDLELQLDLTNQRREQDKSIEQPLKKACPIRLRPILMTYLTIILATLPTALGVGAGSDSNAPMAVAVIGGMLSSTLLSLFVFPAVYSLVEGALRR